MLFYLKMFAIGINRWESRSFLMLKFVFYTLIFDYKRFIVIF